MKPKLQQSYIGRTDSPQDKAVISAPRDICSTESCKEFLLCQQQLNTAFGCIPLTAINTYKGPVKIWNVTHNMIKASCLPIFLGLRIPVDTNLNVPAWRKYLCNYIYISPLMTRNKSNSDCRTIFDLSFPKSYSVNDGVLKDTYLGTKFQMHYPTVDIIVNTLNTLGPGANIFKVDISRAFRHLRIDPGDIDLLGLQHRDKLYLDLSLPFGYRLGAFFFSKISDAVRYIMSQHGHNALLNYIDDLIYCGLPAKIHESYQFLVNLLHELGLDISQKKLQSPDTKVTCLGIEFDTINRTMSIPSQKLSEIIQICKDWTNKDKVYKSDLQSLLGSLLYITKCVKPARFFLNRMLQLLRNNVHEHIIVLNQEFFKDLAWFNTFLNSYNGVTMY